MTKIADKIKTDRIKIVSVRMSNAEHHHLTEAAESRGMKLSALLRFLALERFPLPKK